MIETCCPRQRHSGFSGVLQRTRADYTLLKTIWALLIQMRNDLTLKDAKQLWLFSISQCSLVPPNRIHNITEQKNWLKCCIETLTWPHKETFDRSSYKWCLNANVILYEPGWKRCNQPFLIQTTVVFKRMATPFLIVYVIHQNCHLQPLRAQRFISKLPLVFATHPISTSSKSATTSLTLPGMR